MLLSSFHFLLYMSAHNFILIIPKIVLALCDIASLYTMYLGRLLAFSWWVGFHDDYGHGINYANMLYSCRKNIEHEISSMLYGSLTFSWKGYKGMVNGPCFALMRLQAWLIVGARNLKSCIPDMKERYLRASILKWLLPWGSIEN